MATSVDHIVPLAKDGTDKPDNLQSICEPCHTVKTLIDAGQKPKATIGQDGWPVEGIGQQWADAVDHQAIDRRSHPFR